MRKITIIATVLCILSSCNLYKSFKTPDTGIENPYGADVLTQDSAAPLMPWQQMFTDTTLQRIIQQALAANSDMRIARLNIEQSEALLKASKLAFIPSFALAPEGSITTLGNSSPAYSYNLPLTMQWELDLFGKLRNNKEQARAALLQTGEFARMVQTQLIASIANNYYTLVMLDEQLRITHEAVNTQQQNLDVIIALKEAGMQTETAVNQSTANLYNVQATAKDLEKQIRVIENALSLLLHQTPHAIGRAPFNGSLPVNINHLDAIPLTALATRPDVKEAEYALRGSFYGVNVARSAFYPSISLTGIAGWTNSGGISLNPANLMLSALGSLTQPLFSRGVNTANLKVAKVRYEQSLLTFEKTLLTAGNEVNNALTSCQNSAAKEILRQKQVDATRKAFDNSTELMQHSSLSYLEVLIAQNALLQAQVVQVTDWFEGVQGHINLYKALGGGIE